jgi:Spy/CpxP family protein refolding chaperone
MKTGKIGLTLLLLGAGVVAMAQTPPPPAPADPQGPPPVGQQQGPQAHRGMQMMQPGGPQHGPMGPGMMQPGPGRGGMQPAVRAFEEHLLPGPHGKWWDNPQMAEQLSLSAEQKKKMDDIFQQNRLKLVDLNATVQKAEITMEPLVAADQPDEAKIVAQIDKVAQARAELEKANARMLLAIRGVLTPEQFQKLQAQARPGGRGQMGGAMQPRRGPGAPPPPPAPAPKKQ